MTRAGTAGALCLSALAVLAAPAAARAAQEGVPPPAAREGLAAAPPPPRPAGAEAEPPAARPEAATDEVPEPDSYHGEPYRSPVPATLKGAEVIGDAAAHALWRAGIPFVDLLPTPVRPANLPAGTLWRDPPHETIPGATWLANTGYDALDPATERYFLDALAGLSGGRMDAPMVFFCKQDCWMSWNGAKRAVETGYARIFWYPAGTDGWAAQGWPLERVRPHVAPDPARPAPAAP
ncbi:PQQ-dependent catabolism-associated CXXCW motif protein [Amaricoccus solimangrovi]|uniref:PQQ-dependent catabolism-associated CXXCW motif protein n=1 Tax=Amaricoccus solimangrovi TaxID=2589815 RepID=A0A501WXG8_9RHOB|nr:PQQ-dependent catabolism-associated CXXCW motif protein [Amaricoccus solimangrovi]TPE52137.1 PQQ-dependent catabolism-associated CXXCW motif protein [Amaricoccus solimangrovi]